MLVVIQIQDFFKGFLTIVGEGQVEIIVANLFFFKVAMTPK